ncbi:methyltransferase domain-containing protein [Paludicola sp. MB14-C6]|uniref:putative RNA methyltransferase n=1 Tax=Paludihabitans sp. MB14-C6 TaxID=3070656 RepID=UPI0027DD5260|nr:methyltransferase domain-containing protein [Paludicola sp. MB14-C6]WMJ22091.1 methyltransferase domain-containing protein [Paludicola sp. MB14-C6]
MAYFTCPICKQALKIENKSYLCENNHCFDIAKSGYVNLLPSNQMNSKAPGDNKLMVDTRNQFLSKGFYQPLLDTLSNELVHIIKEHQLNEPTIADVGCGEGYYTQGIYQAIHNNGITPSILGIDISKEALKYAAKRMKQINASTVQIAVGSVFHLPIETEYCDILMELFAPYCGEEFHRVLKKNGIMILVIPAENHLFELKQAVYKNPYKNEVKPYELDGFTLLNKEKVKSQIHLSNNEDIMNLFQMTPYYYKTSKEDTERLMSLNELTTTIEFELLIYQSR